MQQIPFDDYGRSKLLGEVYSFPHTTIRTSFIGFPDPKGRGLLHWASQQNNIIGYDKVMWNGMTNLELATFILYELLQTNRNKGRVLHLSTEIISKYDLLAIACAVFGWNVPIEKESIISSTPHAENKTLNNKCEYCGSIVTQLLKLKELYDYNSNDNILS
jgi:dTDP-4-dehydrorhamnose reductase